MFVSSMITIEYIVRIKAVDFFIWLQAFWIQSSSTVPPRLFYRTSTKLSDYGNWTKGIKYLIQIKELMNFSTFIWWLALERKVLYLLVNFQIRNRNVSIITQFVSICNILLLLYKTTTKLDKTMFKRLIFILFSTDIIIHAFPPQFDSKLFIKMNSSIFPQFCQRLKSLLLTWEL